MMVELSPFHYNLYSLNSNAGINAVLLVDLPEYPVDKEWRGKPISLHLCSEAIWNTVRQHAEALGIPATLPDNELMARFDSCFESPEEKIQTLAIRIASAKARYFSHLLRTLKSGANHSARPEWDEAQWEHWSSIRQIVLGGGQLRGNYGRAIHEHVFHLLADLEVDISLSRFGAVLPLIGAARFAPADTPAAIVMDFGTTTIKRGMAQYDGGRLNQLQVLPALPSNCDEKTDTTQSRWTEFWKAIGKTWQDFMRIQGEPPPAILISMATYLKDGQAYEQRGCYHLLRQLSPNFQDFLIQEIKKETDQIPYLRLIHDGTAAASAYAGYDKTAVITLGTWFGIGFSPPDTDFRAIHPEFTVTTV